MKNHNQGMRTLILLLFLFSNSLLSQEAISIEGRLTDSKGAAIPYASIINLTSGEHGTTSNENGQFLLKTRTNNSDKIQIAALGFYELRITVGELDKLASAGSILLKEKPFDLGEVQVEGERYEQGFIGKSVELLKKGDGSYYNHAISGKPGYSLGVFVQPRKKTAGLIDKIHFYLAEEDSLDQPFSIRLLRAKGKLKNNRGYMLDEFDDMTDSPLMVSEMKAGWNTLDLYEFDIYVDNRPFFILFTSLESLEESKARGISQTTESVRLATFAERKPDEIYRAISYNGLLVYLAVARIQTPIPAVYVEYSKLKK